MKLIVLSLSFTVNDVFGYLILSYGYLFCEVFDDSDMKKCDGRILDYTKPVAVPFISICGITRN